MAVSCDLLKWLSQRRSPNADTSVLSISNVQAAHADRKPNVLDDVGLLKVYKSCMEHGEKRYRIVRVP